MKRIQALIWQAAAVAAPVLAADQILKEFVRQHLLTCPPAAPLHTCDQFRVIGPMVLVRTENAGSAFGYLPGLWVWVLIAAMGVILVPVYARRIPQVNWMAALAVGLQLGGALGNLFDRLLFGSVADVIYLGGGMVFDLADVALALGMVFAILVLYPALLTTSERSTRSKSGQGVSRV